MDIEKMNKLSLDEIENRILQAKSETNTATSSEDKKHWYDTIQEYEKLLAWKKSVLRRTSQLEILEKRRSILSQFIIVVRDEKAAELAEIELGTILEGIANIQNEILEKEELQTAKESNRKSVYASIKQVIQVNEYSSKHLNIVIHFLKDLGEILPDLEFNGSGLSSLVYDMVHEDNFFS